MIVHAIINGSLHLMLLYARVDCHGAYIIDWMNMNQLILLSGESPYAEGRPTNRAKAL